MRPQELTPIFSNISSISGIGPKLEILFTKLVGNKIVNLLWHLPYDIIKRENINDLNKVNIGSIIIIKIKILKHIIPKFKRQPFRVNCICNDIPIDIVFFNARHPYIKTNLPINKEKILCGKIEYYNNNFQITHPEYILDTKDSKIINIQPIYSLTKGLTQKIYYKNLNKILPKIPNLSEWIDDETIKKFKFMSWKQSILNIHQPSSDKDLITKNIFRNRLAYDELFANQLAISIIREFNQKKNGIEIKKNYKLLETFIKRLPFELTESQKKSINEISNDLSSSNQMVRLLQGDVGSGKTIVSILGMLNSYESGYQSAIMAPTEILAMQHFVTIKNFLNSYNINIELLSGKDKGKLRDKKIDNIKNGIINIIVGTHALIQEDVNFSKLGFIVIDEQHRFGVHQRLAFTYKGLRPNLLVMTATPIPRTLTLAIYGNMDESRLLEKPKGRLEINTIATPINKTNKLIEGIKRKINNNEKIYWVCPLIEESEEIDLKAATERYLQLKKIFKNKILLIHGQIKSKEKEEIMNKFKNENYNILVSTTVIEVGIDIPNATTIIIEHAERFGLAQLHQLRGRVGRSNIQSNCILLYKENMGLIAKKRIEIMKSTNDGFLIAKQDLIIRGPGEILGKKQSGLPNFKIADLSYDKNMFENIRFQTEKFMREDPHLKSEKGKSLKTLLYLFEKDIAIKNILSG